MLTKRRVMGITLSEVSWNQASALQESARTDNLVSRRWQILKTILESAGQNHEDLRPFFDGKLRFTQAGLSLLIFGGWKNNPNATAAATAAKSGTRNNPRKSVTPSLVKTV